jgi:hypothetical protein
MKVGLHVIPELQNCGLLPIRFAHTLPTRRFGAGHFLEFPSTLQCIPFAIVAIHVRLTNDVQS